MNYYNENDKYCAQWLRNLVDAAFIPDGDVDERSIVDVSAAEVRGYTQCHFFAGIGGWSYALRLAGWPEDRRVWTGSCPCQPFSVAGQRKGKEDARHLWPDFHRLIREVRPTTVMGEQVSGTAGYAWLDGVCDDLEAEGYACRPVDIPACSVGAPHIRQRLYWVANHNHARQDSAWEGNKGEGRQEQRLGECGVAGGLGHPNGSRPQGRGEHSGEHADQWVAGQTSQLGGMGNSHGPERRTDAQGRRHVDDGADPRWKEAPGGSELAGAASHWLGHAESERRREAGQSGERSEEWATDTEPAGYWSDYAIVHCTDNKARRIEPGTFPLVDELSYRLDSPGPLAGKSRQKVLKGYGNAIVPELAAEVIRAWMETMPR